LYLQPLGNRIVVKRNESEAVSPGGIVIPDSAQKKPQRGVVLAVGPGTVIGSGEVIPVSVSPGDEVMFVAYAGEEFNLDGGNRVLLIREEDVLAVVG
jgi:chaperonin GroES